LNLSLAMERQLALSPPLIVVENEIEMMFRKQHERCFRMAASDAASAACASDTGHSNNEVRLLTLSFLPLDRRPVPPRVHGKVTGAGACRDAVDRYRLPRRKRAHRSTFTCRRATGVAS
jgi:hypothetical protein